MKENQIINYISRIKGNPKQRIERDNGGQYFDKFLLEFSKMVREDTINECRGSLKKLKSE